MNYLLSTAFNHLSRLIRNSSERVWRFQGDWVMLRGKFVGIISVKAIPRAPQFNMSYPNSMLVHMEERVSESDLVLLEARLEDLFGEGNWRVVKYED